MATATPSALPHHLKLQAGVLDLDVGVWLELSDPDDADREPLTRIERDLLTYLVRRAPEPVSRDELQREVWAQGPRVVSRALDTTVRRLRQKIEADRTEPFHVQTERSVGYRFVPLVARPEELPQAEPPSRLGTGFVGRTRELTWLDHQWSHARLVTVTGPAGVGASRVLTSLATSAVKQQDLARGRDLYLASIDVAEALRDEHGLLVNLANLGIVAVHLDAPDQGARALDRAEEVAVRLGDLRGLAYTALYRAAAELGRRQPGEAQRQAVLAATRFDAIGVGWCVSAAHGLLAMAYACDGDRRAEAAAARCRALIVGDDARLGFLADLGTAMAADDDADVRRLVAMPAPSQPPTLLDVAAVARQAAAWWLDDRLR